jgi:hypothetical protein
MFSTTVAKTTRIPFDADHSHAKTHTNAISTEVPPAFGHYGQTACCHIAVLSVVLSERITWPERRELFFFRNKALSTNQLNTNILGSVLEHF